jgi:hypothetical protein
MRSIDKKLEDAVNLLSDYAQANLPAGYEITVSFSGDGHSVFLYDPDWNDVEINEDDELSSFSNACLEATANALMQNTESYDE